MRKYLVMLAAILAVVLAFGASAGAQDTTTTTGTSLGDTGGSTDVPGSSAPASPIVDDESQDPEGSGTVELTDGAAFEVDSSGTRSATRAATSLRSCGAPIRATGYEVDLMEKVNRKRAELGNQRMCVDPRLMRSSQYWANYMANNYVFYHSSVSGPVCGRADYCGYDQAFENIAYNGDRPPNTAGFFNQYLTSTEGHRGAMLGANRDRMGTAFRGTERGGGITFNAQHFTNHPGE